MKFPQHNLYKNVFEAVKHATGVSLVKLTPDFDDIQFVLQFGIILTISNKVGSFEVGDQVEGSASHATGVVALVPGSTTLVIKDIVGTFTGADSLEGSLSGATADVDTVAVPNFTVGLFKSNQEYDNPPDPSLPASSDNQYEQIAYIGEPGGVNYTVGSEFNPNTGSSAGGPTLDAQSFVAGTKGAVWVFLKILAYTSGALVQADIDLFNNN